MAEAVARGLVPTVYTRGGIEALGRAVGRQAAPPLDVHLKVNTGMHRVGADPEDAVALAGAIAADPRLRLGAVWTHLAVADGADPVDREFTPVAAGAVRRLVAALAAAGIRPPMTHVANSAGTIAIAAARHDLVRCGIALYGVAPTAALAGAVAAATGGERLRPVLSLRTRVTFVRDLDAGERPSYGRRRAAGPALDGGHRAHRLRRRGPPPPLRSGRGGAHPGDPPAPGRGGDDGPDRHRLRTGRVGPGGGG